MILNLLRSAWMALAVLAALGDLFFGHAWRGENAAARALTTSGVQAIATVVVSEVEVGRGRRADGTHAAWDTDHVVTYAWTAGFGSATTSMRIEREVPPLVFHDLSVGDRVPVRYLPDAPSRVEVVPGELARWAGNAGFLAMLLAARSAGLATRGVLGARRSRRLHVAECQASGRVEAVRHEEGSVALTVSFRDLYGMSHRVEAAPAPAARRASAVVGAEVPLRYDPQGPGNVALG